MSLTGLIGMLEQTPAYRRTAAAVASGGAHAVVAPDAAKPLVIAALRRSLNRPMLALCPHPDDARRLLDQLEAYCGDDASLLHFAEAEVLPYERLSVEAGTMYERIRALGALHRTDSAPPLIVASVTGLLQRTLSPTVLEETAHTIRRGQRLAVEPLLAHWRGWATPSDRSWTTPAQPRGAAASWTSTGPDTTPRCGSTSGATPWTRYARSMRTRSAPANTWSR